MRSVWCPFSKLVKCIKVFIKSRKLAKKFVSPNQLFGLNSFKIVKPTLIISMCGATLEDFSQEKCNASEEVLHNVALATIALKDGNIEKSGYILLKTLDYAETYNLPVGVISVCELLSSLELKLGEFQKAEKLLNKALDTLRRQGVPEDDNSMVGFILKLSRIYSSQGNDDLAEVSFNKCLKMQETKLKNSADDETFLLRSSILYWYGKFLMTKNRLREAKICFEDCFLTSSGLSDLLPNQIMVILYNLGEVCRRLGEHDEAIEHLLKGVSIDKKCQNPDLTYFYCKLGIISMSKGLYKEAKEWCDQAQKLAIKQNNPDGVKESNECLKKLNSVFVNQFS